MGYASKYGRRPQEYASKASHQNIIKDKAVQAFLKQCTLPKTGEEADLSKCATVKLDESQPDPVKYIVAIDGGYTEVFVRREFPSSTLAFFQFGALAFSVEDLDSIQQSQFIFPEQMAKLKNIQRLKLAVPTKGVTAYDSSTLTESVRKTVHTFFTQEPSDGPLAESFKWFLFAEYSHTPLDTWMLASCPVCEARNVEVKRSDVGRDFTTACPHCDGRLYLTDVFRLHEAIDDELGAGGVLGYLVVLIEQMLLVHLIKVMLDTKPGLLRECLFLKDGPLGFFGQTANMYKPMRRLVNWLYRKHDLFLVGAEKSGAFVEHADAIAAKLEPGTAMLLNNDYIYRHIVPGEADPNRPYGSTTYYGAKVIFKTPASRMYVLTLPTRDALANPRPADFQNLHLILRNVARLRCDMYDSSLIPVALVNKLVSLADHPSTKLIERFAQVTIGRP